MGPLGVSMMDVAFGAEAELAFRAMTAQPSTALKVHYNRAIIDLKSAGIWTKLDALYLMNAETAQAARVNIKNPGTYDLTATNSPTFTAKSGYTGNGSSAYLDTNFNPSTAGGQYTQNSASQFVWSLKAGQDAGAAFGFVATASNSYIWPRFTDDRRYSRVNTAVDTMPLIADGSGLLADNRSAAAVNQVYRNGASVVSDTQVSSALGNSTFALLKERTNFYSGGLAMGGFGSSMTVQNHADLYTILLAFKTGVDAL